MAPVRYSLHYETYSDHLMSSFGKLLQTQSLVDMTLMCSSHTIRVHKAVLSASSVYFQDILQKQSGEPLLILKMKFGVLKCLVEFMYCGKTQCLEENIDELVAAARFLKIKGLSKVTRESLNITSTVELPIFTPPVVINRPPQSIIDLHAKDTVVRIPFDIESGGVSNKAGYTQSVQYTRPRRGRPSFRQSASNATWESTNEIGRATERALLRREQDSRNAIHQLKNLQSQNTQEYMDRLTLSRTMSGNCNAEFSKKSYMDNDLVYMNQTIPSSILNPSIPCSKSTLSNDTTASFPATTNVSPNGDNNHIAMSQYVNALKNAGLPTDLPILFESGDGSYVNVNEQVLLDMVRSSEIQYEVIEQPNLMESVPDLNEIKSIDDLSKCIERGEMLMGTKPLDETSNFSKENERDAINSLNDILPDNLDAFGDQTNYVALENNLSNINSIQNDNTNDLSCIDNDLHFFTKSMSDDVKKYYEEPHLNDGEEMGQYCPGSDALDTNFNMSLLDTKSMNLGDPMNETYSSDLSRNDDCFSLENPLPNPSEFKDETLDYLISTPKRTNVDTHYDVEKHNRERNKIINDLMSIEMNINEKDKTDTPGIIQEEPYKISDDIISPVESNDTENNMQQKTTVLHETNNFQMSYENSIKTHILDKTSTGCNESCKSEGEDERESDLTANENIPFAVGLLPLQKVTTEKDTNSKKRKNQDLADYVHDIDSKCLKRKMKNNKK